MRAPFDIIASRARQGPAGRYWLSPADIEAINAELCASNDPMLLYDALPQLVEVAAFFEMHNEPFMVDAIVASIAPALARRVADLTAAVCGPTQTHSPQPEVTQAPAAHVGLPRVDGPAFGVRVQRGAL